MSTFFNSKDTVFAEVSGLDAASMQDLQNRDMVPRGSAVITSSGALAPSIKGVLHAATGTMDPFISPPQVYYEPSLQSVDDSIAACFQLGKLHQLQSLAIPFIGGNIFKKRIFKGMGLTVAEENERLVSAIVGACVNHSGKGGADFCIVAFKSAEHTLFLSELTASHPGIDPTKHLFLGDITDYRLHGCDGIVNAANMEVKFGGGLSFAIAQATQDQVNIDNEAKAALKQFWTDYHAS